MYILGALCWIIAARLFGDWRHWEKYHHTILYFIACDLLYNFLTYKYPLWEYTESNFLPNHTSINLIIMFIVYPCSVLIYIPYMDRLKRTSTKLLFLLSWVVLYGFFEWLFTVLDLFHYHHGWTLISSIVFDFIMFTMLYLHYKRPLIAYVISIPIIIVLLILYDVPVSNWR
ncbi:CBO0543 family protein [Alkalihalobacillus sp. CinArs1]|uniref:CBO0543 family protein n=1 Tax=Alkalihalobacillus sp. CinArs1 TaxID=2995314 RepID=UPI0022DDD179|nr:CBO0543 family protein [Alkalihalobacillus sp. CinArs1]